METRNSRALAAQLAVDAMTPELTAVLFPESVSHVPGTAGSAGTESLSRASDEIRSAEKAMPALMPGHLPPSHLGHPVRATQLLHRRPTPDPRQRSAHQTFQPCHQASLSWPLPWVTAG